MKKEKLRSKEFMRNKRSFILLTILSMGIGFAYLTSNLTINGNTSVSGNSWNVYLTNVQVTDGSVDASVVPTTTGTNTTSIDYTILLDKPGDFYEFTVDAVNGGTIDAMIESITTVYDDEYYYDYLPYYIKYTVEYLDGSAVSENQLLAANTTETYKIRIEFSKEVRAEDLEENDMNLSLTFGVNYKQSNLHTTNFTRLVANRMISDKNLDFSSYGEENSVDDGLFLMNSTAQNQYPIYYYRGDVENNYAKFAGFCWKIVRTTDTGGTKLIYNGTPGETYAEYNKIDRASYTNIGSSQQYPYTYDSTSKEWSISAITYDEDADYSNEEYDEETWDYYGGGEVYFEFSVAEAGDYVLKFNVTDGVFYENLYYNFSLNWGSSLDYHYSQKTHEGYVELFNLTPSQKIVVGYIKSEDEYGIDNNDAFHFSIQKAVGLKVPTCENMKENAQLSTKSKYNENNNSPAYIGYMYGTVYDNKEADYNSSHVYGNSFTYSNGTYTLKDTNVGVDNNHHYTCFNTSGTCTKIAYVFYKSGSKQNYLEIANGKSIEDALNEMQVNTTDSTMKTVVDNWFNNTFKTYFTTNSKDYNNYLEDTVWCNDRSLPTIGYNYTKNNMFKPNGGNIDAYYGYFAFKGRNDENKPSLVCTSKNDAFTVSDTVNGNGALTYPVGLLTADELIFAGTNKSSYNQNSNYLYTGEFWRTMTPSSFGKDLPSVYDVEYNGGILGRNVNSSFGVRPSISINKDVRIASGGDGSALHPYEFVVE